ncbi:MAG: hypothetical protein NT007_03165 [Candidatus Kapabacteria bacterium]|nr:hypothetical protein [Candidatus Kapabacteria bacterium]
MIKSMRQSTLETIGLGSVHSIFSKGKLPVNAAEQVDKVFGPVGNRGSLVISGANGIVGAGKLMQFGSRLKDYNIPIVALDFPGAPDGITPQYKGLASSFGKKNADEIMANVIRLNYDGNNLPSLLKSLNPKFLLEAIPEILNVKKAHFELFRSNFPGIEIRSVTSGFPSKELGVGIYHPAFPHQINKIWEVVENEPSEITKLLWALGMIPMAVSDEWSFVLDVLFCGLMVSALRYNRATNIPFWKIDKYIRKFFGPNPFRAHDVIGAKGANFLTWNCLHDLSTKYGDLFAPTEALVEHKDSGQNWYPLNHLRPMVNTTIDAAGSMQFNIWILGSLFQMTSLMIHEKRSHFSIMNSVGELCAQFRKGTLALMRNMGAEQSKRIVEAYHKLHPEAALNAWHPEALDNLDSNDWKQLYVNAEHDGEVGVITLGREAYNDDVNAELNRAIDWLKAENIHKVILTGDFHLTTQLVGADTNEFFPALDHHNIGYRISYQWSKTARRLYHEFETSVAFINGKRCLGGMLELFQHCHYIVTDDDSDLGAPEVNLPVVPGMEMCHLPFRRTGSDNWAKLIKLLLEGRSVKGKDTVGWLTDYSAQGEAAIKMAWELASKGELAMPKRKIHESSLYIPSFYPTAPTENKNILEARKAIMDTILASCGANYHEALKVQSECSAKFMTSDLCRKGFVGQEAEKTMNV